MTDNNTEIAALLNRACELLGPLDPVDIEAERRCYAHVEIAIHFKTIAEWIEGVPDRLWWGGAEQRTDGWWIACDDNRGGSMDRWVDMPCAGRALSLMRRTHPKTFGRLVVDDGLNSDYDLFLQFCVYGSEVFG